MNKNNANKQALGGNCSVGARRALGRIAQRACSVALGGISGVADSISLTPNPSEHNQFRF